MIGAPLADSVPSEPPAPPPGSLPPESAAPNPAPAQGQAPAPWRELALYLTGGFGVFLVASVVLAVALRLTLGAGKITIWVSLALYGLNFLCLGGAAYVLGVRRHKLTWAGLGLWPPRWRWHWPLLAAGVAFLSLPLRVGLGLLVQWLAGNDMTGLQARAQVFAPGAQFSWVDLAVSLLGVAVLAPLAEELYFRGLLHGWFKTRFRFWVRVLLSTCLFALGHFDSPAVVASSFVLGLFCAVAYELSQSLWLPILIHSFNNGLAIVLVYAAIVLAPHLPK